MGQVKAKLHGKLFQPSVELLRIAGTLKIEAERLVVRVNEIESPQRGDQFANGYAIFSSAKRLENLVHPSSIGRSHGDVDKGSLDTCDAYVAAAGNLHFLDLKVFCVLSAEEDDFVFVIFKGESRFTLLVAKGPVDPLLREPSRRFRFWTLFVVHVERSRELVCQAINEHSGRMAEICVCAHGRRDLNYGGFPPKISEEFLLMGCPFQCDFSDLHLALEIVDEVVRGDVGENPPLLSVLAKKVDEVLMAEYPTACLVKCPPDPRLSFSNAVGSHDAVVVSHRPSPLLSQLTDIGIYTNVRELSPAVVSQRVSPGKIL